jgi:hypothetical protein
MPGRGGGGRGVTPTHSILGPRRGGAARRTLRPIYPLVRTDTNYTAGWVGIEAGLDGTENLAHTGIRSHDRLALACSYTD